MKFPTNVDFQTVFSSSTHLLFLLTPAETANSNFCSAGIFNVFADAFLNLTGMLATKTMEQKSKSIV